MSEKILKCPACNRKLKKMSAGKVSVGACDYGCGGIWFDRHELSKLNEANESSGDKLFKIRINPDVTVDKNAPKICPVCEEQMYNYMLKMGKGFVVDECLSCGGMWLDGGEFANLRNNSEIANASSFVPVEVRSEARDKETSWIVKFINYIMGY